MPSRPLTTSFQGLSPSLLPLEALPPLLVHIGAFAPTAPRRLGQRAGQPLRLPSLAAPLEVRQEAAAQLPQACCWPPRHQD